MEFREGASVYTAAGEEAGRVGRVVIDPRSTEVTALVVSKGLLFPEDRVLPVDLVASADEERVMLTQDVSDLDSLPPFIEIHYIDVNDREMQRYDYPAYYAPPVYWYPAYGAMGMGYGPYVGPYGWPTGIEVERNIAEGNIALKEGANVVSADGDHVGDIESVLTDTNTDQTTHFVISQGLLFKDRKLVPANWVRSISEDKVYLAVGSRLLEDLPEYREES